MKTVTPKNLDDWKKWLEKNHLKEDRVLLIKYKKHTGRPIIYNIDSMKTAICFGWIDTTAKRVDENKYAITYVKRNKNSKWSINTLRYGKELLENGLMSDFGIKMYKEGLAKKPHDFGIPANPRMPKEMKVLLEKNKKLDNFLKLSPSRKKMYFRMFLKAQRPETKASLVRKLSEEL